MSLPDKTPAQVGKEAVKTQEVKAKTDAKKANGEKAARDRTSRNFDKTAVITLNAEKNPKREGSKSHTRFAVYKTGQTVEQFIVGGGTYGDLAWDSARGYISIAGYTPKLVVKKEPKAKAPATPTDGTHTHAVAGAKAQ